MMTAAALRRELSDDELACVCRGEGERDLTLALRAIIDRLADTTLLFEASDGQRDEIARRAAKMLVAARASVHDRSGLRLHFATGDRRTRASAVSHLARGKHWTPTEVVGSLEIDARAASRRTAQSAAPSDGTDVAYALLTAAREVITHGVADAQQRLMGSARVALQNETDGADVWDAAMHPLLGEFAHNARVAGASRMTASLRAIAAAAHLKGSALQERVSSDDEIAFHVGASAAVLLSEPQAVPSKTGEALARLAHIAAETNAVRLMMWDGSDQDSARLMGAAAAFSVFGKGSVEVPRSAAGIEAAADGEEIVFPRMALRLRLPEGWQSRFAHLSAHSAAEILDGITADPRADETTRASAGVLSDALKGHADPARVSFNDALGFPATEPRIGALRPGARIFSAVPRGTHRATAICKGKRNRTMRCRAVADHDGALVGYLAFDPLSRELAGRPLYAVYALDGNRYGYAFADEPSVIRRGEPMQGFMTAPETISV